MNEGTVRAIIRVPYAVDMGPIYRGLLSADPNPDPDPNLPPCLALAQVKDRGMPSPPFHYARRRHGTPVCIGVG